MVLPLHIAQKLQQLLLPETAVPGSGMKHNVVNKMLEDGILQKKQISKSRYVIFIPVKTSLTNYLHNHFGISDLDEYISKYDQLPNRAEAVTIAGNSKLRSIRTFKGFLVSSTSPVATMFHGKQFNINPPAGSFIYMYDYEDFKPDPDIVIVGVENAENFRRLSEQEYLFTDIKPLFVSRYPQSNDLIKWLQSIPNPYLHFGDLDFEGIKIYKNEYKKFLTERACLFIPSGLEDLLMKYGNRALYNRQYGERPETSDAESSVQQLMELLLKHSKVLEQEIFIKSNTSLKGPAI
ncbi:hypothetical protein [Chitinophaga sp.]|uniref:hypothetical protein n=1 Tax=Chitinophaga sp. TaxID=1869181 RepID=UPI00106B7B05